MAPKPKLEVAIKVALPNIPDPVVAHSGSPNASHAETPTQSAAELLAPPTHSASRTLLMVVFRGVGGDLESFKIAPAGFSLYAVP